MDTHHSVSYLERHRLCISHRDSIIALRAEILLPARTHKQSLCLWLSLLFSVFPAWLIKFSQIEGRGIIIIFCRKAEALWVMTMMKRGGSGANKYQFSIKTLLSNVHWAGPSVVNEWFNSSIFNLFKKKDSELWFVKNESRATSTTQITHQGSFTTILPAAHFGS